MRQFDTKVQLLKYRILKEVAKLAWDGKSPFDEDVDIPHIIIPGKNPTMRCCIYKERAIVNKRVKLAVGANSSHFSNSDNVVKVIDIACDDCPASGFEVTDSCRGCLAHRCMDACKRDAIKLDHLHRAHIDKSLCVECGQCAAHCPYEAIINRKRPCMVACKPQAISIDPEGGYAVIDDEKCVSCGACVVKCPWGAIQDKSFILDAIDIIRGSKNNTKYKVVAIIAPSIAGQFTYAKTEQVIAGLLKLGFDSVEEAALGADIVAAAESAELLEKGFLSSSCCPAYVAYIKKNFPELTQYVSHNLSPMAAIGKYIKEKNPDIKTIFIGPCIAKKKEAQLDTVKPYIDCVITFEELQALFDSWDLDITKLEPVSICTASYFGRVFGRAGGLTEAMVQGIKEHGREDFEFKPCLATGLDDIKMALLKKSKNALKENFIEGMMCSGGCACGPGSLMHGDSNRKNIDAFAKQNTVNSITESLNNLDKRFE